MRPVASRAKPWQIIPAGLRQVLAMNGATLKFVIGAWALAALGAPVAAQTVAPPAAKPEMRGNCPGLVATRPLPVIPAAFRLAALEADQVRLTYIGHSTFLIESPQLVRIATDYNDYVRPPVLPDIVTMNQRTLVALHRRSRSRHQTRVARLGGQRKAGAHRHAGQGRARAQRAHQHPTWGGDTERHGNSIFIFEIANLCIAHLGHLHHTLTQAATRRNRPRRRRDGAGRRRRDARSRRHGRGAACAESAADDPDALFQFVHARPFACSARVRTGTSKSPKYLR